ncbi:MAG: hypothetical protein V1736_10375 [Pseudomonadota bacterium]
MKSFPKILVRKIDSGFEGLAGLELKSILKGDLFLERTSPAEDLSHYTQVAAAKKQRTQEALIHALSSWPSSVCLELYLTAFPNLSFRPEGRILIALVLRAFTSTKQSAQEEIASRYLSLMPLLSAHMPEAEFVSVVDEDSLWQITTPFATHTGLAVLRREEVIALSTPLKRLSIGFEKKRVMETDEKHAVRYRFPWMPSLDDWSRLLTTLLGQLDPIQLVVRIRKAAGADPGSRLRGAIETCEFFLSGAKEYQMTLNRQASLIRDLSLRQLNSLTECALDVGTFVFASHPIDESIGNVVGRAISRSPQDEQDYLFQGGFSYSAVDPVTALNGTFFP